MSFDVGEYQISHGGRIPSGCFAITTAARSARILVDGDNLSFTERDAQASDSLACIRNSLSNCLEVELLFLSDKLSKPRPYSIPRSRNARISAIVNPVQRFRNGHVPPRAASRSGSSFWLESRPAMSSCPERRPVAQLGDSRRRLLGFEPALLGQSHPGRERTHGPLLALQNARQLVKNR
jgi:hypothetical protein